MNSSWIMLDTPSMSDHDGGIAVSADLDAIASVAAATSAVIGWAEEEIARASGRHPVQADVLFHAFGLLRPRDIGPGMGREFVYRSHARELLERVAAGADTRPATAAEVCLVCAQISVRVPLHGAAAGVYFRMWLQAFPDRPATAGQAAEQVHYERIHGTRIGDLEAMLRRRAADETRTLADVACGGRHYGDDVTCRYATSQAGGTPAGPRVGGAARLGHRRAGSARRSDPLADPDARTA